MPPRRKDTLFWEWKLLQASPNAKNLISGSNNQIWRTPEMQQSGNPDFHVSGTLFIRFLSEYYIETSVGLRLMFVVRCPAVSAVIW